MFKNTQADNLAEGMAAAYFSFYCNVFDINKFNNVLQEKMQNYQHKNFL